MIQNSKGTRASSDKAPSATQFSFPEAATPLFSMCVSFQKIVCAHASHFICKSSYKDRHTYRYASLLLFIQMVAHVLQEFLSLNNMHILGIVPYTSK